MAQYPFADGVPLDFKLKPEDLKEFRDILEHESGKPVFETEEELQDMARNLMQAVHIIAKRRRN